MDGAGRQKGPVAKMTNMRTSMPDFSPVAQTEAQRPCSAFFHSSYPDTAQATVLLSDCDTLGSQTSSLLASAAAIR